MNAKKAGLITGGILAVVVATAPAAWAFGAQAPEPCAFTAQGDDATQESVIITDNPANAVPQAPVAGNNTGIFGECSTYGQNNNEGNFENNTFIPPLGLPQLPQPN